MPDASDRAALTGLLDRRLLFVGGKGGVGKTTIAAALAIAAADRGRRCLVVSTDPAHSLGDVFDVSVGGSEKRLDERLWGLEIDPDDEAERHIAAVKLQMKNFVHPRMYGAVDRQLDFARLAPGTMEAALLERMAELMADAGGRFDLVLFDTAPTGHTLRLLSLPDIMMAWTEGLLQHDQRSSALASTLKRFSNERRKEDQALVGEVPADHPEGSREARIADVLRTRQRKLRRASDLLLDRTTSAFVLVLNPDKLSLLESRKALAALEQVHVPVEALVVNRVLPEDADGGFIDARRRHEVAYRVAIDQEFAALPRIVLPLMAEDVHGLDALRRLGRRLIGS